VHYNIPYPRLEHASQFKRRYFMDAPRMNANSQQQPSARCACHVPAICPSCASHQVSEDAVPLHIIPSPHVCHVLVMYLSRP
jgi:hypothetical protein